MSEPVRVNLGSGQRKFEGWINVDVNPKWEPEIVADGADLSAIFKEESVDVIVLSHTLEHYGCNEGNRMLRECRRVLRFGGSLIVSVPDMRALAEAWMKGKLDDETYMISVFGAYMGSEADRHKFGFTWKTLLSTMRTAAPWSSLQRFNYRAIEGMDLARDYWILAAEAVK